MDVNFLVLLGAALIPTIVGFVWYNPKVLGTAWMKESGVTEEKMKGANMPVIFGVSLILSFFFSWFLYTIIVHQTAAFSLLLADSTNVDQTGYDTVMSIFGDRYRTFGHGAFHGLIYGFIMFLPVLGTNALFERKSWKYIFINVGYWTLTAALMGGILAQFA